MMSSCDTKEFLSGVMRDYGNDATWSQRRERRGADRKIHWCRSDVICSVKRKDWLGCGSEVRRRSSWWRAAFKRRETVKWEASNRSCLKEQVVAVIMKLWLVNNEGAAFSCNCNMKNPARTQICFLYCHKEKEWNLEGLQGFYVGLFFKMIYQNWLWCANDLNWWYNLMKIVFIWAVL